MNLKSFARIHAGLESIAPLAGSAGWDNTGWIIKTPKSKEITGILLCIDLTDDVVHEAHKSGMNVIVAYHPPIFHPVKAITCDNPLHSAILQAAAHQISVYSPHTALDRANGGLNDWLASLAGEGAVEEASDGFARLTVLSKAVSLRTLWKRYNLALSADHARVCLARRHRESTRVRRIAVCAGSGASSLQLSLGAEVWITGEMGHHDLLAASRSGVTVILTEHTRTERPFLPHYARLLRGQLPGGPKIQIARSDREILRYQS